MRVFVRPEYWLLQNAPPVPCPPVAGHRTCLPSSHQASQDVGEPAAEHVSSHRSCELHSLEDLIITGKYRVYNLPHIHEIYAVHVFGL